MNESQRPGPYALFVAGTAILLVLALADMPAWYFRLLRFVVFIAGGVVSFRAYAAGQVGWSVLAGCLALVFNPIAPLRLARSTWALVDVAAAGVLFASIFFVSEGRAERTGDAEPIQQANRTGKGFGNTLGLSRAVVWWGILAAGVALLLGASGLGVFYQYRASRGKTLERPRTFPFETEFFEGAVSTSLRLNRPLDAHGRIYYRLTVDCPSTYVDETGGETERYPARMRESERRRRSGLEASKCRSLDGVGVLFLRFLDRDGFLLYEQRVNVSSMTWGLDSTGAVVNLSHLGQLGPEAYEGRLGDDFTPETYERFDDLAVAWR